MRFSFEPRRAKRHPGADRQTFRVARLWTHGSGEPAEVSHLIDRTYDYASLRELQWHLADRFSHPVRSLTLQRV